VPTLAELIATFDRWYPPAAADSWDAVGLVCGDPDESVSRILLAIDAVPATVAEAERVGAQLLFTHHPLLLTAVHGVPASEPKGALVHRLIRSGIAHFVAHTNAEVARPGVSDALAAALRLIDVEPLVGHPAAEIDDVAKLVVFVPEDSAPRVLDAITGTGAGALGDYDNCAWTSSGTGTFRAGPGARPSIGRIGETTTVAEVRIESVVPRPILSRVLAALRAAHPYEEPAFDVLARVSTPTTQGVGRIGSLPRPARLHEFTAEVAAALPAVVAGVKAAGDPERLVQRIAVLAGSGSSLTDAAAHAGADVYVTADLKHHNAVETVIQPAEPTLSLIDVAHWASERPWLDALAARVRNEFGATVDVVVSDLVTDPWALHAPSGSRSTP
jgi:dinuclear metal center YbgI/SA1388 family protein